MSDFKSIDFLDDKRTIMTMKNCTMQYMKFAGPSDTESSPEQLWHPVDDISPSTIET